MAGEEQRREDEKFSRSPAPANVAWDLMDYKPSQTPPELGGLEATPDNDFVALLKATRKQGNFLSTPFVAGLSSLKIRPQESRTYFFIQNISGAGNIIIGFGFIPTSTNGLVLTPGSAYEPFTNPTNEIYIIGSAAAVNGLFIYSVDGEV